MATTEKITLAYISENAVLLEWPEKICPIQHQQIIYFQQQIQISLANVLIDTVASYASLIIYYQFDKISWTQLNNELITLIKHLPPTSDITNTEIVEIPVYYGRDTGWDLEFVAQKTSLSIEQVIDYHSQTTYHAYALGFTPGFCYLASLPKSLQLPRKSTPRLSVPHGSVAIAEQQTAVYPISSPAGWHIIGQTPIKMFSLESDLNESNINKNEFSTLITVGQQVRFQPIDKEHFLDLGGQVIEEKVS